LYALGRNEEATEWAELGASDDMLTQMLSRQALAKLAARRRDYALAQTLAGEAVAELERAAALYERKGATACLARARATLGRYRREVARRQGSQVGAVRDEPGRDQATRYQIGKTVIVIVARPTTTSESTPLRHRRRPGSRPPTSIRTRIGGAARPLRMAER
jgi:hypothetical protein